MYYFDDPEISNEDQEKIEQFIQTSQKKQKSRAVGFQQKGSRPVRQTVRPLFAGNSRPGLSSAGFQFRAPAVNQSFPGFAAPFSQEGVRRMNAGGAGFQYSGGGGGGMVQQRPKILVNPRFCRPQPFERPPTMFGDGTSQQQLRNIAAPASLMNQNVPFQPYQQAVEVRFLYPFIKQQEANEQLHYRLIEGKMYVCISLSIVVWDWIFVVSKLAKPTCVCN